jgi:DNA sulfur modification protein DndC
MEAELEISGLGNRRGILQKLESVLRQDWDDLETINERNEGLRKLGMSFADEITKEFAEFLS